MTIYRASYVAGQYIRSRKMQQFSVVFTDQALHDKTGNTVQISGYLTTREKLNRGTLIIIGKSAYKIMTVQEGMSGIQKCGFLEDGLL